MSTLTSDSLRTLTELQLRVIGLESLTAMRQWWTRRGMRRFLVEWASYPAGSCGELRLLLGLVDSRVEVGWTRAAAALKVAGHHRSSLRDRAFEAAAPAIANRGEAKFDAGEAVRVTWRRRRLAHVGRPLSLFVSDVIRWCGTTTNGAFTMGWRGVALVVAPLAARSPAMFDADRSDHPAIQQASGRRSPSSSGDGLVVRAGRDQLVDNSPTSSDSTTLLLDFARLHGVRRRRALPVRLLMTAEVAKLVTLRPGQLVVTERTSTLFVANARTARLVWRFDEEPPTMRGADGVGEWRIVPLAAGERWLNFAVSPEAARAVSWEIDGIGVKPSDAVRWPHWIRLKLPTPTQEGRALRLTARRMSAPVAIDPNGGSRTVARRRPPATTQVELKPLLNPLECRRVELSSERGLGWVETLTPFEIAPGRLTHPVAGHQEVVRLTPVTGLRPPRAAEPTESVLARARGRLVKRWRRGEDLQAWLGSQLALPCERLHVEFTAWYESHRSSSLPVLKRGWLVTLQPETLAVHSNAEASVPSSELLVQLDRLMQPFETRDIAVRVDWAMTTDG